MPVPRLATAAAHERLAGFPVLTITGPRQSGKTTLARMLRPDLPYFSLEDPDTRAFAAEDPRAFLRRCADGAIWDEVQRAPQLLSYLQTHLDSDRRMGRFILTGSSQFALIEAVTQSLAGRSGMLTLLPFSLSELQAVDRAPKQLDSLLQQGLFPPIYDRPVAASIWLQDYFATYVERDVRALLNIKDLSAFQRFVQLCAGRIGQLLNVTSLAADTGITRVTAESWLTVLQASHVIFLVQPWFSNISKRLIKSPKLYFCDVGLAAWLIGVRQSAQLSTHPLRGLLFENWVMTELYKIQTNHGLKPSLYFMRDQQGHEVDAVVETAPQQLHLIEIKSGETIASDWFAGLKYWGVALTVMAGKVSNKPWVIYGGTTAQSRSAAEILPWADLSALLSQIGAGPGSTDP
jgi:predicted AAA+ superfamily ATPase